MNEFFRTLPCSLAWLVIFAGVILFGLRNGDMLSLVVVAVGFGLLLAASLITGRIYIRKHLGMSKEVSREDQPLFYWGIVVLTAFFFVASVLRVLHAI